MIKGEANFRNPVDDPLLLRMMEDRGLEEIPLFSRNRRNMPERAWRDAFARWEELAKDRDGEISGPPAVTEDARAVTGRIKEKAIELGADDVGIAELTPSMVNRGETVAQRYVISLIVQESYAEVLGGALAVEIETIRVYVKCAEISTALGKYIRDELGFPAVADHNGTSTIQAIPALAASGLGEMGKHGSLIHRDFGAGFRPAFVMTDLPLVVDQPDLFGVQDYCMNCRLCEQNCPPAAIPDSEDYVVTEGYKRWLTNIERCYEASRLRDEYCHICVDVCPYVHKENGDPERKSLYKSFMQKRRKAGWRTPQWFIEDEDRVLQAHNPDDNPGPP